MINHAYSTSATRLLLFIMSIIMLAYMRERTYTQIGRDASCEYYRGAEELTPGGNNDPRPVKKYLVLYLTTMQGYI